MSSSTLSDISETQESIRHSPLKTGDPSLLAEKQITPMEAVNALYSEGEEEICEAIVSSLRQQIFGDAHPKPSGPLRRWMAGILFRIVDRTTRPKTRTADNGLEFVAYENYILERCGHPYALTLLEPNHPEDNSFVEGGDPMNAPYMMISPEIKSSAGLWDRILLDSVLGKDVQLRFIYEARATREAAIKLLEKEQPVRLKAAAAGTGLNMILVYDQLIREGHDPSLITVVITDRCENNVAKMNRLMDKLATTRGHHGKNGENPGISTHEEDLLDPSSPDKTPFDVITLVGILEYFHGYTSTTTEEHLGEDSDGMEPCGKELSQKIALMTAESGTLVTNTYRVEMGARILEVFGKKMRYRDREDLHSLAASAGFIPVSTAGSGHVYDVEVFKKP